MAFGGEILESATTIALGIAGVAIVAVLVSKNAQTPAVLQAAGSAYSNALDVAVSPVTGASTAPNLSYPSSGVGIGNTMVGGGQGFSPSYAGGFG